MQGCNGSVRLECLSRMFKERGLNVLVLKKNKRYKGLLAVSSSFSGVSTRRAGKTAEFLMNHQLGVKVYECKEVNFENMKAKLLV